MSRRVAIELECDRCGATGTALMYLIRPKTDMHGHPKEKWHLRDDDCALPLGWVARDPAFGCHGQWGDFCGSCVEKFNSEGPFR